MAWEFQPIISGPTADRPDGQWPISNIFGAQGADPLQGVPPGALYFDQDAQTFYVRVAGTAGAAGWQTLASFLGAGTAGVLPMPGPWPANTYRSTLAFTRGGTANLNVTAGRGYWLKFPIYEARTLTAIAVNTGGTSSGNNVYLSLYQDAAGAVGTQLEAGSVSLASGGQRELPISEAVTPASYWAFAMFTAAIGVTANVSSTAAMIDVATFTATPMVALAQDSLTGAPASPTPPSTAAQAPVIWLK